MLDFGTLAFLVGISFMVLAYVILYPMIRGVFLAINPPFKLGEMVCIKTPNDGPSEKNEFYGEVIKIEKFYTFLKTTDNKTIQLPNFLILKSGIIKDVVLKAD